jgi:hypothetical protein
MKADFSLGQFSDIDIFYTQMLKYTSDKFIAFENKYKQDIFLVFWLVPFGVTTYISSKQEVQF